MPSTRRIRAASGSACRSCRASSGGSSFVRRRPRRRGKYTAPASARPATSDIAADVVQRFVAQHRDAVARVAALDEGRAARTVMTSPFARIVTYSVLDGWRLMLAHDRRHVEQARRVTKSAGFPGA